MKRTLILALALSPALLAQDKPAPKLTDAQLKQFYKAQSEAVQAQSALQQAQQTAQAKAQAFQASIKQLQDTCGKDYVLTANKDGDPVCAAKPAEKK